MLFESRHPVDVVLLDLSLVYGGGEGIVERLEQAATIAAACDNDMRPRLRSASGGRRRLTAG